MAWKRAFQSAHGPEPLVRLVLLCMADAMNPDGTRCLLGSRAIAERSGLNKDTAAKYRLTAIETGWLVPPPAGRHATSVEWLPSVPAGVPVVFPKLRDSLSDAVVQRGKHSVSDTAGKLRDRSLSDTASVTVRNEEVHCPTASDKPQRDHSRPHRERRASAPDPLFFASLTLEFRNIARTGAPACDPDREWQRFRDYCQANGRAPRNVDAAWRLWVTNYDSTRDPSQKCRSLTAAPRRARPPTEAEVAAAHRQAAEANKRTLLAVAPPSVNTASAAFTHSDGRTLLRRLNLER